MPALRGRHVDVLELPAVVPAEPPNFNEIPCGEMGGFLLRREIGTRLEAPALGGFHVDVLVVPAVRSQRCTAGRPLGRGLDVDADWNIPRTPVAVVVTVAFAQHKRDQFFAARDLPSWPARKISFG